MKYLCEVMTMMFILIICTECHLHWSDASMQLLMLVCKFRPMQQSPMHVAFRCADAQWASEYLMTWQCTVMSVIDAAASILFQCTYTVSLTIVISHQAPCNTTHSAA